ncbi:hypothetical protein [Francisella hispaniensis]|uniref:hypothetical protein n=1 Tax=Francisella hispaniensis TaxID=622488 RepID=UPI001906488E|nr:hypothetical protein [Francisella hispaniensis]MBK2357090.1 hypothetical protein [Francisella hispaniensis]
MEQEYRNSWINKKYRLNLSDILGLIDYIDKPVKWISLKLKKDNYSCELKSIDQIRGFEFVSKYKFDSFIVLFEDESSLCISDSNTSVYSKSEKDFERLKTLTKQFLSNKKSLVAYYLSRVSILAFISFILFDILMLLSNTFSMFIIGNIKFSIPIVFVLCCFMIPIFVPFPDIKIIMKKRDNSFSFLWDFINKPIVVGIIGALIAALAGFILGKIF